MQVLINSAPMIIGLILLGCGNQGSPGKPELPERVTILSQGEAKRAIAPCSREAPKGVIGTWEPDVAHILLAESELRNYMKERLKKPVDDYYRQYSGILINNQRVLLIHAVYGLKYMSSFEIFEREVPDWRTAYMWICDGHDYSWGVEFYLDEKRFANFQMNQGL